MLLRISLAFCVGLFFYMIAMAATVYDGTISMIIQPIVGSIVTSAALALVGGFGSPLLLPVVWKPWSRFWWISPVLFAIGLVAFCASFLPMLQVMRLDPESQRMLPSPHPVLMIGGWLAMIFSVLYCSEILLSAAQFRRLWDNFVTELMR